MPSSEQTKHINIRTIGSYLHGLRVAIILVAIAVPFADWINNSFYPLSHIWINVIQFFSVIVVAAALYGKKAIPEIWTTGNSSEAEKFNNLIFNIFSTIGFFSSILAYQLSAY